MSGSDGDRKDRRVLRDTTKPEHRPSWGASRDNAPNGAAAINWGDKGVPVPTPGGTGSRKGGLFANGDVKLQPAKSGEPNKEPRPTRDMFSQEANRDRADETLRGQKHREARDQARANTVRARINKEGPSVFDRSSNRDDDLDRGR